MLIIKVYPIYLTKPLKKVILYKRIKCGGIYDREKENRSF